MSKIDKALSNLKFSFTPEGSSKLKGEVYFEVAGIAQAKAALLADMLELIDCVEPCEPDCTPVRHAYHEGQWQLHLRQEAKLKEYFGETNE